jgi:general secretion pathway protein A
MPDLLSHWNLRERPFEATWDTRFFFPSPRHEEALNRLCFLAAEQTMNMGMLTGEIGCGKTMTRAVFARSLDPLRYSVVTEENAAFTFRELMLSVLRALEPDAPARSGGKAVLFQRLQHIAHRLHTDQRHLVLIFDEAQEMAPVTLNELKLLTNLNAEGRGLLTLILVGQPELHDLVARLPATNQRISLRFHLGSLHRDEVHHYLRHRLQTAGHPTGDLFQSEAVDRLCQASQGIPRQINRLAKLAVEYAWLRGHQAIPAEAVNTVVRDLERQQRLTAA